MHLPLTSLAKPANAWAWAALLVLTMVATATPDTARADTLETTPVTARAVPWASLSAAQKQVLSPLADQWQRMDAMSQEKWLRVADRYPSLPAASQQRVMNRMQKWARLPDSERGQARVRYQQARQLSPQELQERWQAYQALSPEERQDLARVGLRKKNPVLLQDTQTGPPEMAQMQTRQQRTDDGAGKRTLVPAPTGAAPAAVAPAMVKAGPGATTSLVNQTATPPLHQHTGLPKINTSQGFVNPQTLLPLRGPQGAGMTPVVNKP
jgi:Protein of unknown function (DUF3106)